MSKVFISYSHDSPEHMDRILALSQRLRQEGVDCQIDQYQESPPEGWPNWCTEQIEESHLVLVVCTEPYLLRFRGKEVPGKGLGGTWEGHIITQELYNAQGKNSKFIPVVFSADDRRHIPLPLQSAAFYDLSLGYETLYRRLTSQPRVMAAPLGEINKLPSLPILERKQAFLSPSNIPHARNPFFTGREKLLERLKTTLQTRHAAALSGIGGVGKTQTAIEYAWRHRDEYQGVFWTRAETREDLVSGFAAIAKLLNLPQAASADQQAAAAAARQWFEQNSGWLLILDNADDIPMVRDLIPSTGNGQILLTTRAHATGRVAERIEVDEMEPEEGALFLLRRAGIGSPTAEDRKLAVQISKELGGLPLALDQAGAFIEETPSSLAEYLALYKSEAASLLDRRGEVTEEHKSVTVTFSLAFEKVAENSGAAADLIRVCSFLAPDGIPEEIFSEGAPDLGDNLAALSDKPLELVGAIGEAARYSLVDRNSERKLLSVHRLVQIVVRASMDVAEQRVWAERLVRAVKSHVPFDRFHQLETMREAAFARSGLRRSDNRT